MQKGKISLLVITSNAPFPFNQLSSQSKGAVRSVKTILHAGGYKILKTINVANAKMFDTKRDKIFQNIDGLFKKNARYFA